MSKLFQKVVMAGTLIFGVSSLLGAQATPPKSAKSPASATMTSPTSASTATTETHAKKKARKHHSRKHAKGSTASGSAKTPATQK